MTTFLDYIRDEVDEEWRAGYLSDEERARRLALLADGDPAKREAQPKLSDAPGPSGGDPAVAVGEDDPALSIERPEVPGGEQPVKAYLARPAGGGRAPGIIVIHENKGLVPYIENVARRLAKLGYVALAPDLLSRAGGTDSFADAAEATAELGKQSAESMVDELLRCVDYLANRSDVDESRLGAIGFCFGGGMTWRLATREPRLVAAVPFYGPNPPLEDVPNIRAAVLAIYGGLDERINAGIGDIEDAMAKAGKSFEKRVYEGAQHAFHNDTNPDRYNKDAATNAWSEATAFFARHLGG